MAVITKIEQQKNKARVNIFVDDAFFCGLLKETAVIFKLKVGKEIDETVLKELNVYNEIYKQPNRKTCALLPFESLKKVIDKI